MEFSSHRKQCRNNAFNSRYNKLRFILVHIGYTSPRIRLLTDFDDGWLTRQFLDLSINKWLSQLHIRFAHQPVLKAVWDLVSHHRSSLPNDTCYMQAKPILVTLSEFALPAHYCSTIQLGYCLEVINAETDSLGLLLLAQGWFTTTQSHLWTMNKFGNNWTPVLIAEEIQICRKPFNFENRVSNSFEVHMVTVRNNSKLVIG